MKFGRAILQNLSKNGVKVLAFCGLDGACKTTIIDEMNEMFPDLLKAKGLKVIGLAGAKDSKLERLGDCCIRVLGPETYKIKELYLPVYHCLCMMLEDKFFGDK